MRNIKELTADEIFGLEYGYINGKQHYFRVKCKGILMSNEGKTVSQIAEYAQKTPRTIRNWFDDFEQHGIERLIIQSGRGIKANLDALSCEQIKLVKAEIRKNYQNLKAVSSILTDKLGFKITIWMLMRFIKKNSIIAGEEFVKT